MTNVLIFALVVESCAIFLMIVYIIYQMGELNDTNETIAKLEKEIKEKRKQTIIMDWLTEEPAPRDDFKYGGF